MLFTALTIQIKLSCRADLIIEFDYKCFHAEPEATCYIYNNKNDQANGTVARVVNDNKVNDNQDNLPGNPNDEQGMYRCIVEFEQ